MVVTSIDIDPSDLRAARTLVRASSNAETVEIALKAVIASRQRQQAEAIERIISRHFDDEDIDAPTITPAGRHEDAS